MKRTSAIIFGLAAMACSEGPETTGDTDITPVEYSDQRVDGFANVEVTPELQDVLSSEPAMCVTPSAIHVFWIDNREGFFDVWMNTSENGGENWLDTPIPVKQGNGGASGLDVQCLGKNVFVTWEDDRDGNTKYQNIYFNRSEDGGESWLPEDIAVDNDPDGLSISLAPQMLIARDGEERPTLLISWFDQLAGPPDVYMSNSRNIGDTWQPPVRVSGRREEGAGVAWSGNPLVSYSGGRVHVLWEDMRNQGRQDIYYASSGNRGNGFLPEKRIDVGDDEGDNHSFHPRVASEGDEVYIVWSDWRSGDARDIFYNYSADAGQTWLTEAKRLDSLDSPGFSESFNPEIVMKDGVAHVAWQDATDGAFDIYYRQIVGGEPGETEIRADKDEAGQGNSADPKIAIDGSVVVVSWEDFRDDGGEGYNELYYNYLDLAEGEGEPQFKDEDFRLDSTFKGTSFALEHTTIVRGGVVHTTWIEGRNGSEDIYYSKVQLGESLPSPEDDFENAAAE